ncbi:hypothetical protein M758_11G152900 [Ceratodon purpureus]|nr:hypothetical protein M758_11G152900 [Ceratodon purpureus]
MLEFAAMAKRHGEDFYIMPVYFGISLAECRNPVTHKRWLKIWQRWAQDDRRIHLEEWKKALRLLRPTTSLIYTEGSSEVKFREDIVNAVCRRVPPATMMDDSYVRGKSRFSKMLHEKIEVTLVCPSYGVRVLGLHGTGGIGKSTICKVLCNEYYTKFQGRVCHLELREDANELQLLQEALRRLTDTKPELLVGMNIDMCRYRLKAVMHRRPVFLVIDNILDTVKSIDQATTYLKAGYNQGSIVVVAARSIGQLTGLGIDESECLEMPELEIDEARSLFLDQFQIIPENIDEEDEELLMRCVKRCRFRKGDSANYQFIPLALKVLGTQLWYILRFNPKQWVGKLEQFDNLNLIRQDEHPIFSVLRWSFDALQREDQLIFIDAALFFPRFKNDWSGLIPKWNVLEWLSLVHGINVDAIKFLLKGLQRKSLLENLGDGFSKVGIHDLWHEFAVMETTRGKYEHWRWLYYIAGHRSPLLESANLSVCKNLQRIMCFGVSLFDNWKEGNTESHFGKVTVLHLDADPIQNGILDLTALMHLKSLALNMKDDGQIDIVGLGLLRNLGFLKILCKEISVSSVEDIGCLTALQVLELKVGQCNKLPDLRKLTSLRVVSCNGFRGVETIAGLSSDLIHLKYLIIRSAISMSSFPGVDDVIGLQELDVSECYRLEELPNLQKLTNLQKLCLTRCKSIKGLPGFGSLVALQELLAYDCTQLTELPDMRELTHLRTLWCNSLKALPGLGELIALEKLGVDFQGVEDHGDLHQLTRLHTISITGWSSRGLPSLVSLASLYRLEIHRCKGVQKLTGVQNLSRLKSFYVDQCEFQDLSVLSNFTSLQELLLEECYLLERLPDLSKLTQLESITIEYCYSLQTLVGIGPLLQLETLHCSASAITELPDLCNFPRLRRLYLRKCRSLCSLFSTGPLNALVYLNVYKCRSLESLPDLSCSLDLHTLELRNSGVLLSPHDVKTLKATCRQLQINMDR